MGLQQSIIEALDRCIENEKSLALLAAQSGNEFTESVHRSAIWAYKECKTIVNERFKNVVHVEVVEQS